MCWAPVSGTSWASAPDLGRLLAREPHVVDLATASDWLCFEAARGGVPVFEREAGAWARFQAQAAVTYFDLAPMIALCTEGVRRRLAREAKEHGAGDLVVGKRHLCQNRIAKIGAALPAEPERVTEDERTEAFIAFNLFLLVQDAVDLAAHLIAERGLDIPASHREAFETLSKAGTISGESARAMGRMAAIRNRIAHTYGELDPVRMVREAPAGLDAVAAFLDELIRSDSTG